MFRRREPESGPLLLATFVAVAEGCVDLSMVFPTVWIEGVQVSYHCWAFAMLCLMYALVARFQRVRTRLRETSREILVAHEEERRRLARELHDGVVQAMLAIKLGLEMLRARVRRGQPLAEEKLTSIVDETSSAIDELRRVSHDLRPEALEHMSIQEAMKWHAGKLQESSGVTIAVSGDAGAEVPAGPDHLGIRDRVRNFPTSNSTGQAGRIKFASTGFVAQAPLDVAGQTARQTEPLPFRQLDPRRR